MRLLKRLPSNDFKLISFNDDNPPQYAILSHTWTEGQEVTYNELVAGSGKDKTGYDKIRFCGRQAAADDLEYFWVDTCCIDKSASHELSTAINSMFRWYQRATKCYVYLSDVVVTEEVADVEAFRITWEVAFRQSRWFTRGWTLQELLAPTSVEFFSKEGKWLGNRIKLEQAIHEITKIPIRALRGQSLIEFSVEERMSWAAKRTTMLKEDKVYCLMGIFGVFLSLIYGEGEAYATLRLTEEIQKRQKGRGAESLHDLSVSATAKIEASTPKPALEYKVFLVASNHCNRHGSDSSCMSIEDLDIMASGGWDGVKRRCGMKASGALSMGRRITEVLPPRPNMSWETRWRLYVYCAPCSWHSDLALLIAGHIVGFNGYIRVDDRLIDTSLPGLDVISRMQNLERMLNTVEYEWRLEGNYARSYLSSSFDLSWLQRRNLLLETASGERDDLTLQAYLEHAKQDERVAAIVIVSSVAVIERLANRYPVSTATPVRDGVVYQLNFSGEQDVWTTDIFSRL